MERERGWDEEEEDEEKLTPARGVRAWSRGGGVERERRRWRGSGHGEGEWMVGREI